LVELRNFEVLFSGVDEEGGCTPIAKWLCPHFDLLVRTELIQLLRAWMTSPHLCVVLIRTQTSLALSHVTDVL
jgi:hypothetical protein